MKILRAAFIISLLLAVTGLGNSLSAVAGGSGAQRHRWKDTPVKIFVSSSLTKPNAAVKADSDVLGALRGAMEAWSSTINVTFEIVSSDRQGVSPATGGDGVSLVTIAATPENVIFFAKDSQKVAGKTRTFFDRRGLIYEADIVLNPFQQFSTDGSYGTFDLQTVFTHEIGHLLGFRHSMVLGSVMAESVQRNGSTNTGILRAPALSDPDIAAARDLYGTADVMDNCCSVISGKITNQGSRSDAGLSVWAEDVDSGRVMAQAAAGSDGAYRLGGIAEGRYRVLAAASNGLSQEIGVVSLGPVDQKVLSRSVDLERGKISLEMLGLDGALSGSAIAVAKGTNQVLFASGRDLDTVSFSFRSPHLVIDPKSLSSRQLSGENFVAIFEVAIDEKTSPGIYSLVATSGVSGQAVLVGAVRVR